MPDDEELISQKEACRRYGIWPSTLRERVKRGEIETFRLPIDKRPLLVRARDVEAMLVPQPIARKEVSRVA